MPVIVPGMMETAKQITATTAAWALRLLTALFLTMVGTGEGKVYYSCGAIVDSAERGLILSPGFPNNYYPNMHCVWQFFVPTGSRLLIEIFDFDVFQKPGDGGTLSDRNSFRLKLIKNYPSYKETSEVSYSSTTREPHKEGSLTRLSSDLFIDWYSKNFSGYFTDAPLTDSQKNGDEKDTIQEQFAPPQEVPLKLSTDEESVARADPVHNYPTVTHTDSSNYPNGTLDVNNLPAYVPPSRKVDESYENYFNHQPQIMENPTPAASVFQVETSPTQPPAVDVCPNDVLYISDLITFSSRFCGTNSPLNKTMIFGSSVKMVEVIMELITTTGRGRGFVLLFEYRNETHVNIESLVKPGDGESMVLLAVVGAAMFFTAVILVALCMTVRQKMCPKRSTPCPPCDIENGIQNSGVEINELQLVMVPPSQASAENENNNHVMGLDQAGIESSHPTELEDPSLTSATNESGSDEVFVISTGPGPSGLSFSSFRIKDRNLKRCMTSPSSLSNWLQAEHHLPEIRSPVPIIKHPSDVESSPPRPRAWSVRTFCSLLPPLPQLQRKWCSWTTNSPFTKLVDSGSTALIDQCGEKRNVLSATHLGGQLDPKHSESLVSNASYPLTQSAQQHRKLNTSNIKKSRFASPCFGFLSSTPNGNPVKLVNQQRAGDTSPDDTQDFWHQNTLEASISTKSSGTNGFKIKEIPDKSRSGFTTSENLEDRQPLVSAEHLEQCGDTLFMYNNDINDSTQVGAFDGLHMKSYPASRPEVASSGTSDFSLWVKSPSVNYSDVYRLPDANSSSGQQDSLSLMDTSHVNSACSLKSPGWNACHSPQQVLSEVLHISNVEHM
ncbi:uncharacterized protein LOC122799575 isoform X1 [Protopterus annectens]|uniref:uncharacterized protein LOC122799575 isoform X1 n=1 Tax=Protopterus annectens TaxID=7888 RepID=UPI001CFA1A02|nr:uncharacterized protein LOC122799575 isoform X1 [Protopterus annectens]